MKQVTFGGYVAKAVIISNDEGLRYLYEVAVAYQKIDVFGVSSLADGIKAIAKIRPDIVILDIMTPEFENTNLVKELKDKVETLPVIILTDMKKSSKNKEACIFGACKFMVKGESSLGDLIKTVRKVVKK